jgi:NTP pyrophosphatase (non-canonical NTP hydrolase)
MPTLEECMKGIRILVKEKGHEDTLEDFNKKLLFAFIELGEAGDIWKKHKFGKMIKHKGKMQLTDDIIAEELIDVIFYVLDAFGLMHRDVGVPSPDEVFIKKLEKNMKRKFRYGRPEERKK